MYDLSICLPAIYPEYWECLYQSFVDSCTQYTFELVLTGPYRPSSALINKPNLKYIKSFATSVRSAQTAAIECEGRLIAIPADDGYAFSSSFDRSIELIDHLSTTKYMGVTKKHVIVLRYREGKNFKSKSLPKNYWSVKSHPTLRFLNIPRGYKHAVQPLLSMNYFREIGGFDCRFEHLAMAAHDLSYRIQNDGGLLHLSPIEVMNCDWCPSTVVHRPIEDSHNQHDYPLFKSIYSSPESAHRIHVDYNNWKKITDVWARRWPHGVPE